MTIAEPLSSRQAYGVTYASLEDGQLLFESELAFQLEDGSLLTLHLPTPPGERQAIQRAVLRQIDSVPPG
ncbi:type III secretion system co-regulatory protein PtrC [Zestomonas carbonaria]|uniref:Uncharacterized protein n=1 Tax=Zestomonas carbonaria TaxID=2762745 RepID=A0A7U7ER17_9GAMM|nr:type III secretion system co-regulatory protein PtrC [Pseudomonas carbonaria]CAD5109579.1 hypothetical protein PSEWESI4_03885 [Pseudomonas carbonaria]